MAVLTLPILDFEVPVEIVVLGLVTGLTYGLLGVGLTLTYKTTRIINFAYGEMGALPALIIPVLVLNNGWSYWLALPLALLAAAAVGGLMELGVIRRLHAAPRLIVVVATIGVSQLLFVLALLIPREGALGRSGYPTPFDLSVTMGNLRLTPGHVMILLVAPLIAAGITFYLKKTKVGLASRAAAENRDASWLAGIPVNRVSLLVWTLAGLLAGASAILVGPTQATTAQAALGPSLMVRGLAACLIGGLTSFPQVFVGGLVIGLVELLVSWNYPTGGMLEVLLFGIVLASLLLRRGLGQLARGGESSTWSFAGPLRALDPRVARHPRMVTARRLGTAGAVALAVLLPLGIDNAKQVLMSSVMIYAVIGMSLVVLTGFAGQVSLGQFAFVGLGAAVAGRMFQLGYPAWTGLLYAILAGGVAALVIGIPALRVRGLFLAVATLSFALAAQNWLFSQDWLVVVTDGRDSLRLPRQTWLGVDFQSERNYYWLCLASLLVTITLVQRLRRSGVGRTMMAIRDNEPAAATLAIPPRRVKLLAFVLAGMIAAFGGWLFGGLLVNFDTGSFGPQASLSLVVMVIFGGVTSVGGAVLGALWVRGIPYLWGANAGLLSSGIGLLVVLLFFPGGLIGLAARARDRLVTLLTGEPASALRSSDRALGVERTRLPARPSAPADVLVDQWAPIECRDLWVRFGGNVAVGGVSVTTRPGEIVGLVGPNGAGKTTLFDVLSGQLRPDSGLVLRAGYDITGLRPEQRAELGVGRSFQQARLFDEMTLLEVFKVALERHERSETVPSLLWLPPARRAERRKQLRAHELIDLLGLGPFASRNVSELSTGTRRLAELGCIVALGAEVLLLDEPTAGIAQREVEAFTPALREIRDHLDATAIVIDHDIPMLTGLVDRMYVLAAGSVIAEGPPLEVRENPAVIAAYLGTDERTISRSGQPVPVAPGRAKRSTPLAVPANPSKGQT